MFPCTQCGACCLSVKGVLALEALGWVAEDGSCRQYNRAEKRCRVYRSRPLMCRVDEGRPAMIPADVWQSLNLIACDVLHKSIYGEPREREGVCPHDRKE
ncbi:MAG: YkgJ family cysteine cluster protein [Planctomycetaceae bacterium]|nr:MAG: YkgJ family cysteine cluster protein [Planctomycetaceae bacterium]